MFGDLGELANVNKQDDGFLLLAGQGARAGDPFETVFRVQKRGNRYIPCRAKLAGKPHIIINPDTLDGAHLMRVRWRQLAGPGHDAHPAGGTAPLAATY